MAFAELEGKIFHTEVTVGKNDYGFLMLTFPHSGEIIYLSNREKKCLIEELEAEGLSD